MTARVPTERTGLRPAKLSHVVLKTDKLEEMAAFYRNFLGADTLFGNDRIVFLTYDDEHHRLALVRRPNMDRPQPNAAGLDHFAFSYRSLPELAAAYERLKAHGIRPDWQINHGLTTSLYYRDPDGNRVEIQVDNFPSVAALNEWLATGAFDRNPIGVEIDMDEVSARSRAGTPDSELLRPRSA